MLLMPLYPDRMDNAVFYLCGKSNVFFSKDFKVSLWVAADVRGSSASITAIQPLSALYPQVTYS